MDTKAQITSLAEDLLLRHGFDGFSYAHIAKPLNIRNAAVHYHFASKVELGLHLLESCRRPIAPRLQLTKPHKPRKALWRYLEAACDTDNRFSDLRIIAAIAANFDGLPELLKAATRTATTHHRKWLSSRLKAAGKLGQVQFDGRAKAQACKMLMSIQGGHLHAKINGNSRCLAQLLSDLKSELTI